MMKDSQRKEYWRGYRAMKAHAYDVYDADKAFRDIYNSNEGAYFVRGAERAKRYIERVGIQNITA